MDTSFFCSVVFPVKLPALGWIQTSFKDHWSWQQAFHCLWFAIDKRPYKGNTGSLWAKAGNWCSRQHTRCIWAFMIPVIHSNSQQSHSLVCALFILKTEIIVGNNKHLLLQWQQLIKCDGILLRIQSPRLFCFVVWNALTEMKAAAESQGFRYAAAVILSRFGAFMFCIAFCLFVFCLFVSYYF